MKNNLVSIIVTCFNQERFILSVLESVKNQTYKNWECIVVDDGSSDGSAKLVQELTEKDSRFKYIYQKNQGVSIARNTGFSISNGDYINFLDGDDTFLPYKLERQLVCFKDDKDLDICVCDHQHYIESEDTFKYYKFEELKSKPIRQHIYGWQNGVSYPSHAALYKRDIWFSDELPFPIDYKGRSEDWVFNIMVALKDKKYYFLKEVLCNYHHYGENYTSDIFNSTSSAIHAAFYITDKLPEEYQSDFIDFTIKKSMNRYLEKKKIDILNDSGNWRLGNYMTKPVFQLKNFLKKLF